MAQATREEVADFLKGFKDTAVGYGGIFFVSRREYDETRTELEINKLGVEHEIYTLTTNHYSSGPDPDYGEPGEVWVFGKNIRGREVYIKLKVSVADIGKIAKCLSFHIAVRPLKYPYAE